MNATIDNAVLFMQVFGLAAMAYGLVLTMKREKLAMSPRAAKAFARY